MTDNLRNGYQGRFLTGEEFKEAYTILKEKSSLSILKKGKDIIGMHIEITLD